MERTTPVYLWKNHCGKLLLNIKALDLSLEASVTQKLYLNPNGFSSRLLRMAHPVFKNGPFPFIQISQFQVLENEIMSKILLLLKQDIESWLQFQFNPPEKTEQILQPILWLNSNIHIY